MFFSVQCVCLIFCPHFAFGCAIATVQDCQLAVQEWHVLMPQRHHFLSDDITSGYDVASGRMTSLLAGPDATAVLKTASWLKTFERDGFRAFRKRPVL